MKTGFGYIRVSTQKQGLGVSLIAQKDAIIDYASANGISVTEWFEEKETAAKIGRPIFDNMLKRLRRKQADVLLMHKVDRSARNMKDWSQVSDLPTHGVELHFAGEGLDFTSRGGRLTANLQAVIAEDYIHNLRQECIKGLKGRLKQGLYPFRAPIGYLDNGRGNPKTPCPEKAPLIRQAFDLYASGQHSIISLQTEMTRLGLRNLRNRSVSKHGIETILNNTFYCGLITIKRTGETYDGIHESLISPGVFQRVQDVKTGKCGKKVTRHNHLYRGLFKCATCQRSMIPERQKGRVYYRCHVSDCPKNIVREDRLEAALQSAYRSLELSPKDAERLRADWLEWLQSSERSDILQSLKLRLERVSDRLQRLTDLLLDGAIDNDEHATRKRQLKLDKMQMEEDLEKAQENDLNEEDINQFLELVTNLAGLHICLDPGEKRYLVENCFSNRTVDASKPMIEPYSWLQSMEPAELTPLVSRIAPLLELLSRLPKS